MTELEGREEGREGVKRMMQLNAANRQFQLPVARPSHVWSLSSVDC